MISLTPSDAEREKEEWEKQHLEKEEWKKLEARAARRWARRMLNRLVPKGACARAKLYGCQHCRKLALKHLQVLWEELTAVDDSESSSD